MTEILAAPRSDGRDQPAHGVSMSEAFRVWLRVAALSFGGPAGQIAVMHRILVEEKSGFPKAAFCMLSTTACSYPVPKPSSSPSISAG